MPARRLAACLSLGIAACSGREGGTVAFAGVLAGAGDVGRVEVVLQDSRGGLDEADDGPTEPAEPVLASGRVVLPSGATIPVSGSYDRPSETMYVSGGGYVLGAYLEHDLHPAELVFEGYYRGPDGGGRLSLHEGEAESVRVLCGSFQGSAEGRWAMVLGPRFTTALAVPFESDRPSLFLVGSISGSEASYHSEGAYHEPAAATALGVIAGDGTTAAGSWTEGTEGGEWVADVATCLTP